MINGMNLLLMSLALLGLLAVALPLAWPQRGHELEEFDNDLKRRRPH
jgi:hypothetical protein